MNFLSFLIIIFVLLVFLVLFFLNRRGVHFSLRVVLAALFALILGLVLQLRLSNEHEALQTVVPLLTFISRAYTGALRLLVVPMLLFGVISVVVTLYLSRSEKTVYAVTSIATVVLLINTGLASVIGAGSAIVFNVGSGLDISALEVVQPKYAYKGLWDALIGYIPTNIFSVLASSNALQVAIVAALLGFATVFVYKQNQKLAQPFVNFVESGFEIIKSLANIIISLTPYGVFALLTRSLSVYGWNVLISLGNFVLANIVAFFLLFVLQLSLACLFGGISPFAYVSRVVHVLSVAFSTRSSFSTIPVTMQTLRQKFFVHPEVSRAVPSIGASIGMNACAGLWPALVAVSTLQALGTPITLGTVVLIAGANIIASIGVSGIPGTATVAASASFALLGLPFTLVPLVKGVDFFVDMGRTALNVNGTISAAVSADSFVHAKKRSSVKEQ